MLAGTSLEAALDAKLRSLDREFLEFREKTSDIGWCREWWWDKDTGMLSFKDWKVFDAMHRSRSFCFPGIGLAMVPFIDMANHASGDKMNALYEADAEGNALLVLCDGAKLKVGDEITITYGDDKGACEMLFSYGFLDPDMISAKELFLSLEIPDDDPLKLAKEAISKDAPGFRLYETEDRTAIDGAYVWLLCVNEEDGLNFRLLQTIKGDKELQVSWKESDLDDLSNLQALLKMDPMWHVFQLRATTILQARVEEQLVRMNESTIEIEHDDNENGLQSSQYNNIMRLRQLEETLMRRAYDSFEAKVMHNARHDMVSTY